MAESKSAALPLGYTPIFFCEVFITVRFLICKPKNALFSKKFKKSAFLYQKPIIYYKSETIFMAFIRLAARLARNARLAAEIVLSPLLSI